MTAESLAAALGARHCGGGWMASCPAHEDKTPSLAIGDGRDGRVLVKCHAGCGQDDVIAALRGMGLWPGSNSWETATRRPVPTRDAVNQRDSDRAQAAARIWAATIAAEGTLVERYLRSRSITIPVPASLRFAVSLNHPTGVHLPAMVATVTNGVTSEAMGIHRTFLAPDGMGKASVMPSKMMLGPCGGGVVRLGGPAGGPLMIGEGIETSLAAMQATSLAAWAALSASGLKTLNLPPEARDVIVLADGDAVGEAAALDAAHRWVREGRRVRIARPPDGIDFNDMLVASVITAKGVA